MNFQARISIFLAVQVELEGNLPCRNIRDVPVINRARRTIWGGVMGDNFDEIIRSACHTIGQIEVIEIRGRVDDRIDIQWAGGDGLPLCKIRKLQLRPGIRCTARLLGREKVRSAEAHRFGPILSVACVRYPILS